MKGLNGLGALQRKVAIDIGCASIPSLIDADIDGCFP